jgi:exonuclease SbcC
MTDILLRHLEITNFRSIKGTIQAPLDAKVVLVHGENGAGKTSLLSAIELALTGRVISLQRADPQYMELSPNFGDGVKDQAAAWA